MKMNDILPMGSNQEYDLDLDISLGTEEPDIRIDSKGRVFLGDFADELDSSMTSVGDADNSDGTSDQRPAFGSNSSIRLAEEYDSIESNLRAEEREYSNNGNQDEYEQADGDDVDNKSKEISSERGQELYPPIGHVTEIGDVDKSCTVDARKPVQDDHNNTRKRHKKNNYSEKRDVIECHSSAVPEQEANGTTGKRAGHTNLEPDSNGTNGKRAGHTNLEQDSNGTNGKRVGHAPSNIKNIESHDKRDRSHRSKVASKTGSRNVRHKPAGHKNPTPADDEVPVTLNEDIPDGRVEKQAFSPAREVRHNIDRNAPIERQLEFYKREYYNYKLSWELDQKRIRELLADAKEVERREELRTNGGLGFDQGERLRLLSEIDKLYAEKESMHSVICHLTGVTVQGGDMKGISMPSIVKASPGSQKTGSRRAEVAKTQGQVPMLPPIIERSLVGSVREQTILSSEDDHSTTSSEVGSFNDDMSKSILQLSRQERLSRREESPTGRSFY